MSLCNTCPSLPRASSPLEARQSLSEDLLHPALHFDPQGNYRGANTSAMEMFHTSPGFPVNPTMRVGKMVLDWLLPEVERFLDEEAPEQIIERNLAAVQSPGRYHVHLKRQCDKGGHFQGVRVSLTNVRDLDLLQRGLTPYLQQLTARSGKDFFLALTATLAGALRADFAFIARFVDPHCTGAQTLAFWNSGTEGENFTFMLEGTACENVLRDGMQCFPRGFQKKSTLQVIERIGSYAGIPLTSPDGSPLGLLAVFGHRPLLNGRMATALLRLLAPRASRELEKLFPPEEPQRAGEAIRRSRAFADTVLNTMSDAVCKIDVDDYRILGVNQAFAQAYNLAPDEAIGRPCYDIIPCQHSPRHKTQENCPLRQMLATGRYNLTEHLLPGPEGEGTYVEVSASPIRNEEGRIVQAVYVSRNVTGRKRAEQRIHKLAYFDGLTGLPNRTLFYSRLRQALDEGERLAVLFIDLDRFKEINDTLGHGVGDQVLKAIARRLTNLRRHPGDTIARLGGDEFAVLLTAFEQDEEVGLFCQQTLEALTAPTRIREHTLYSSASIGISLSPEHGTTIDSLLQNADTAMFQAKAAGRNRCCLFSAEMMKRIQRKLQLEGMLRQALEEKQLTLHYQPQVDARSGEICGHEALLRWEHPEYGPISPEEFIPVAEETGLIMPLGEWALLTACAQNMAWQKGGLSPLKMAVNLSVHQFRQPGLAELVELALEVTAMPAQLLELEITETALMADTAEARQCLDRFREMGVQLAIDDFGTGYSSLNYLKHFPISCLKIDRSFVRDLPGCESDAAIVRAIIALADSLGLQVLAEGVETPEQMAFFQEHGCHLMQGYLFARPAASHRIEHWGRQGLYAAGRNLRWGSW